MSSTLAVIRTVNKEKMSSTLAIIRTVNKQKMSSTLAHQDGHHSAVALFLEAALIQVSDYRLLGASCFDV
jgi:hypothetical protein